MPQNPIVAEGETSATATGYRVGVVRGRVMHADGSPAANIMMQGEGRGNTNMYFRDSTMTDGDGRYELKPYPEQTLTVGVVDDRWAAKSKSDLKLAEGEIVEGVNFELMPGTLITGTMTVGPGKKPLANDNATLVQDPNGGNLVRWACTNAAGRYQFRVGPGTYCLRLPLVEGRQTITVTDEEELVFDGHADRPATRPFNGTVLRPDGTAAVGAIITTAFADGSGRGRSTFKAKTDDEGRFEGQRATRGMLFLAADSDNNQAAVVYVGPDDSNTNLTLIPAKTLTGRLIDADGKPLNNVEGQLQYDVTTGEHTATVTVGIELTPEGNFTVITLPSNAANGIVQVFQEETLSMGSRDIQLDDEASQDLGDVEIKMTRVTPPQR